MYTKYQPRQRAHGKITFARHKNAAYGNDAKMGIGNVLKAHARFECFSCPIGKRENIFLQPSIVVVVCLFFFTHQ